MKPETVARVVVLALLALVGAAAFWMLRGQGSAGAEVIELRARMPENGGWSHETLRARTGEPLNLRMTADDVMHSFAIGQAEPPAAGPGGQPVELPIDLLPGEWQEVSLTFDRPGRYTFYCTRWCGRNHWRMRGTILVEGPGEALPAADPPLAVRLGLDLDAPRPPARVPDAPPDPAHGAALHGHLPAWSLERDFYLQTAPAQAWERLRAEPALRDLPDAALWDAVAHLWQRQTTPTDLEGAARLYAVNCAACHGETGRGDGPITAGLPRFDPSMAHIGPMAEDHAGMQPTPGGFAPSEMGMAAPPNFTDPRILLGASPALLEGKIVRGGMGTGMPYWGPVFTPAQTEALVQYLFTFALRAGADEGHPANPTPVGDNHIP
jgi:mono/diheme cytochrome c family protein